MSTFKRGSEEKVSLATSLLKQIGVTFTICKERKTAFTMAQ